MIVPPHLKMSRGMIVLIVLALSLFVVLISVWLAKQRKPPVDAGSASLPANVTPRVSSNLIDATGSHREVWGPVIYDLSESRQLSLGKKLREVIPNTPYDRLLIARDYSTLLRCYLESIRRHLTLNCRFLRILARHEPGRVEAGFEYFDLPNAFVPHDLEIVKPKTMNDLTAEALCPITLRPETVFESNARYRLVDLGTFHALKSLDESWHFEDFIIEFGADGFIIHLRDPIIYDEIRERLSEQNICPLDIERLEFERRIGALSQTPHFIGLDGSYVRLKLSELELLDRGIAGLAASENQVKVFLGLNNRGFREVCSRLSF